MISRGLANPASYPPVDSVCVVLVHVLYAVLQLGCPLRLLYGEVEEFDVRVEGVLIHRVNVTDVIEHKEQDGRSLSARTVTLEMGNCKSYIGHLLAPPQ